MSLTSEELALLNEKAYQARRDIIDITAWSGGAHIGGGLSVVDMLVILYYKYMKVDPANPQWEDRDRLIL
ncbi:MAG: transketolase, partial [Deltaproteobacteria bacterium]